MWVATFKIVDSDGERNLKNMAFPSREGKQPSHDMTGSDLLPNTSSRLVCVKVQIRKGGASARQRASRWG